MPTPFPGMDPYLERPGLWEEVHAGLIVSLQQVLGPLVRPRYRVAVERRTYLELLALPEGRQVGRPDVLVLTSGAHPAGERGAASGPRAGVRLADLPMPDEVVERYLEVRDVATHEVVTVLEILSPTNKADYLGRRQYEHKRLTILGSATNLVEIDLLRCGSPLPLRLHDPGASPGTYRIVVSRHWERPQAEVYPFDLAEAIPTIPVPLRRGEEEPSVDLNEVLHDLYDRAGYDLAVDYEADPPPPPLSEAQRSFVAGLLGGPG